MSKFWQSKKWLAFSACIIVSLITMVINAKYNFGIDVNIILGMVGLNALYIFSQGNIDSKKTGASPLKPFYESNKFLAIIIGDLVPIIVGAANSKYDLGITPEVVFGLLGLDAAYVLRQGALDTKEPDKH